jgi:hypothetical protein
MTAKTSERRKAAFLKALAETGNQTLSAERAKVSRSWVLKHRKEQPEFDAACRAAIAAAVERLGAHGEKRPPRGWGHLDGEELVVKGTGGGKLGKRVQIARARMNQITVRVERRFLAVLAATCNVRAAYTAAGVSKGAIYTHRKRWPAFARKWDESVVEAYDLLEAGLLEHGENLFSPAERPPQVPMTGMTVQHAIHLLHMHKQEVRGVGRRPGLTALPEPFEKVKPRILRIFAASAAARRLGEEKMAEAEREWARRRAAA